MDVVTLGQAKLAINNASRGLSSKFRNAAKPIATMFSGTAATPGGGSDASDPIIGTVNYYSSTNGAAGSSNFVRLNAMVFPTMTGKGVKVMFKVTNAVALAFLAIDIGNDNNTAYYRSLLSVPSTGKAYFTEGVWVTVYIPFSAFVVQTGSPTPSTITSLRILPIDVGGGSGSIVRVDLAAKVGVYTDASTTGTVAWSMDDSFNDGLVAAKKLAESDQRLTFFPIVENLDQSGYMTTAQMMRAHDVLGAEVGAHCMTNAQHILLPGQSDAAIRTMLIALKKWQQNLGVVSEAFAYPIGGFDAPSMASIAPYFAYARTNDGRHSPTRLDRPLAAAAVSLASSFPTLAQAKAMVDLAVTNHSHLHFLAHQLVASGPLVGNQWLLSDYNTLVDYAFTQGLINVTPSQILNLAA